ncbi:hypothetical protein N7540_011791 [Penicillium herquei]|nr:hypothetical protein N7540_011791 [Penicillium herquei]
MLSQRSTIAKGRDISYSPFGFDCYENSPIDRFREKYRVLSSEWPSGGYFNRLQGWLSKCIRNSIADNQTTARLEGGYFGVTVANSQNGIASNIEFPWA